MHPPTQACVLLQVQGLRAAYEDVTLRIPAAGNPAAIYAQAESFVQLEAVLPSGPDAVGPGSVWPLVESWQLEELSYRVVSTVRSVWTGHLQGCREPCGLVLLALANSLSERRLPQACPCMPCFRGSGLQQRLA